MNLRINYFIKAIMISGFMLKLLFANLLYAQTTTSVDIKYKDFINNMALKPYNKNNRQLNIIKKFGANTAQVNEYRKKAAYLAIDSGKCDSVNSSDVVGEKYLEYEVICQNGAIIYLTATDIKLRTESGQAVIMEKEKALPRSIAKSRCEQLINLYAFNHQLTKEQLKIDRYKISTWITDLGVTHVVLGFSITHSDLNEKRYTGQCIFRHNEEDTFKVSLIK